MSGSALHFDDVLDYWFGQGGTPAEVGADKSALWWGKSEADDQDIARRFGAASTAAAADQLDHWAEAPRGLLALILCTDQFPRCIHRGSPLAFAADRKALLLAKRCLSGGAHLELRPLERPFAYMPFQHSENLADQRTSVDLCRALRRGAGPGEAQYFDATLDYAVRHLDIIERFGRFPHRNSVLGRPSTPEERTFLLEPGSSF